MAACHVIDIECQDYDVYIIARIQGVSLEAALVQRFYESKGRVEFMYQTSKRDIAVLSHSSWFMLLYHSVFVFCVH